MFSCTPDVHATAQEQDDFATRWAARLQGNDASFDLQSYLDADTLPATISAEVGFTDATKDTLTRGCLTTKLFDLMKTLDPTFGMDTSKNPPEPFPDDTVKSMLAMTVFHNKPTSQPATTPVAPQLPLPDTVGDALNALGLNQLLNIQVPTVQIPTSLGIPTPISALINDLVTQLQGIGLPQLPALANLVQLPPLPIQLPPLPDLTLPSVNDIINTIRSIVDATTYELCYIGAKTNGTVKCTRTVLGLPVLIDVQGDAAPDLLGQLIPSVNPQYPTGVTMSFAVNRLPAPGNPLGTPPPVSASVFATWDVPLANVRAQLGFDALYKPLTLAQRSELVATVTNINDATQGNPTIAYKLTQQNPDVESLVTAGITKVVRDANSGAKSFPESTLASLNFVGVPQTTQGTLEIQTTKAGTNKTRFINTMTTSSASLFTLGLLRSYTPTDPLIPCCPVQSFVATADKLPTSTKLDILKDSALNKWTVGYTANTPIDELRLQGADFPSAAEVVKPESQQTVSSFSANVKKLPTKIDVDATLPIPKSNPRVVDVNYRGSSVSDPNAVVVVPSVDFGTLERSKGDVQRSLKAHAEDIPGRMHLVTNLAGDALNTPPGKNLDVDLTYDSSSQAKNLSVDFYDKGDKSTSKLNGTIATLPPWFTAHVGTHPNGAAGSETSAAFNAKTDAAAADGSAALGSVFFKYAKNAEYLTLDNTTKPATQQYAVVKTTYGADGTKGNDDDSIAIEGQYTGLKRTAVSLKNDGQPKGELDLAAKVVNDANRPTTVRFDDPEANVDAVVLNVPKDIDVTYQRRRTGTADDCGSPENTHKVIYDATNSINKATVRVQGKKSGAVDPDNLTVVTAGADNGAGPIPPHMELFANGDTKQVTYRANGGVGQVAASILAASTGAGSCAAKSGINVDLRGLPAQFGARINPENLRFTDLADTTTPIDQVALAENTPVVTALKSAAVAFTDHPNGQVPGLPTANELSVSSDKRGGGATEARVRLEGIRLFKLDVLHQNANDPNSKTSGVVADLQLANQLNDVGVNLDFVSADASEARVLGIMNKLAPNLHLDLSLIKPNTRVQYLTPGGHLDIRMEIGLGPAGQLDTVQLPSLNQLPLGVMMRDSAAGAKKIGILLQGAPSTLDLRVDNITNKTRGANDLPFLAFTDYQPPGGTSDLSIDVDLKNGTNDANQRDPSKDLKVRVVMHGVTSGYGVNVLPIATGDDSNGGDNGTYFDLKVAGSKAIGAVDLDVATGIPKHKNQNGTSTPIDPMPCSQCNLKLTGTISNLPPGFSFHLESAKTGPSQKKETNIEMTLLGSNGQQDNTQSITSVKLNVLTWQLKPGTQDVRTVPQVEADIRDVPARMKILISDGGPKDSSIAQPCAEPSNTLPGITYTAEGDKRDALDLNALIDFVMLAHDPTNVTLEDDDAPKEQPDPVLKASATNLSHSLQFENTADGKFKLTQPDPAAAPTGNIHIEVSTQKLKILNWSLLPPEEGGCGFSEDLGPVTLSSVGGVRFNLSTGIVLDIDGLKNVTLDPGVIINVDGDFQKLKFGLRDPNVVDGYLGGVGLKVTVHISEDINPSFNLQWPPIDLDFAFPLDINMVDLTSNSTANWIDINLLVPCDVDVDWDGVDITAYHGYVDTHPGLLAEFSNGFETTDNAKFIVAPAGDYLDRVRFYLQPIYILYLKLFEDRGSFDAGIRCP